MTGFLGSFVGRRILQSSTLLFQNFMLRHMYTSGANLIVMIVVYSMEIVTARYGACSIVSPTEGKRRNMGKEMHQQ